MQAAGACRHWRMPLRACAHFPMARADLSFGRPSGGVRGGGCVRGTRNGGRLASSAARPPRPREGGDVAGGAAAALSRKGGGRPSRSFYGEGCTRQRSRAGRPRRP